MANKRIKEQIDYGNYPERMDPNLERKLRDPESPYAKNPALKRSEEDVQKLVTNRFKQVVDKLRSVSGKETLVTPRNLFQMLQAEAYRNIPNIWRIEQQNVEQLKALALKACLEEAEIPADWFDFDLHLGEQINVNNFRMEAEEIDDEVEEEIEQKMVDSSFDVDVMTDEELLELETHKRNIINAIIQGAAKKGHYIFQKPSVRRALNAINPDLYDNYLLIMSVNDFNYFIDERAIEQMSTTGSGVAGKIELKDNSNDEGGDDEGGEEKPDTTISAWGMLFPILCHEILKGLEEAKGRYGLPQDPVMREKVLGQTDTLPMEAWSLRIGPQIIEKIRFALPEEIFDEENKGLINWFQMELYKLPADEFLKIIGDVISEDKDRNKKATDKFRDLMNTAFRVKQEYESYDEGDQGGSDDDDEGFDDFLAGLGLRRPE